MNDIKTDNLIDRLKNTLKEPKYKVLFILFTIVFWVITINFFFSLMNITDIVSFLFGLSGLLSALVLGGAFIFKQIKQLLNKKN